MMKLKISEIFSSIQGEGPNAGKPVIFIRLSGCNLNCVWCDTKYASKPRHISYVESLTNYIPLKYNPLRNIVWTGGEPSLQIESIYEFIRTSSIKYYNEIETNGTIFFDTLYFDQVNVSPKRLHVDMSVLKKFSRRKNIIYKPVIEDELDIIYWKKIFAQCKIPRNKVYLMPEGTKWNRGMKNRAKMIVDECVKSGFNFSPRIQVMIYGNKRGV